MISKVSKLLGLSLVVLGVSLFSYSNVYAVTMDNDGKVRENPYGDSKLPSSYVNCDYYDCYFPYMVTPEEIGGISIRASWIGPYYKASDAMMPKGNYNKTWSSVVMVENKFLNKTPCYPRGKRASTLPNFPKTDGSLDADNITRITDKNGNQYYLTAIQQFFYMFPGLKNDWPHYKGDTEATIGGQLVDVIFTNGYVVHFVVGDANASCHTNGGPGRKQDYKLTFSPIKLQQYKNLYHATHPNCLEIWGDPYGKNAASVNFKKKFDLGEEDGKGKIAYYRMFNAYVDDPPKRAEGVGKEPFCKLDNVSISASSSDSSSDSSSNVIKIRKYIIPNRYDSLHICSFFSFF